MAARESLELADLVQFQAGLYAPVAQWIRAGGFYPSGWGFESLRERCIIVHCPLV